MNHERIEELQKFANDFNMRLENAHLKYEENVFLIIIFFNIGCRREKKVIKRIAEITLSRKKEKNIRN